MKYIADFHIHSHYSLATSKQLTPEHLEYWAGLKGIQVLGTGDCIHPGWLAELKQKLEDSDSGLYFLKEEYKLKDDEKMADIHGIQKPQFILTAEISNIYKKNGKIRKECIICLFFPDLKVRLSFRQNLIK